MFMNNNTERSTSAAFTGEIDRNTSMMMVSVIIPTYNSSKFLPEAIESVLNQTYSNVEIVVVDDGSIDDTKSVCYRYPTVKYIYQQNQGVSVARNTGINISNGEYLLFLDSDDCIFPQAVEIGVNCINAHPEVGFVFGRYEYKSINPDGSYTIENTYDNQPEISNYTTLLAGEHEIQCGCVLFRRESLAAVNGFDPNIKYMQDQNLFLRVAYRFPIYFHNQIVSEYRVTGRNVSAQPARMLIAALRTHRLQWDDIEASGNQEYAAAYQRGQQYWLKLFVERLPYEIMRCTQSGQWIEALGHLGLLLNCDPKLQYLDREIYAVADQTLLAKLRKLPIAASLAYWKQQLAGAAPLLSLPTDRPRPAVQTCEGASQSFVISPEITQGLCGLSKDRGVTLFMTLLAAYQTLLYRYTGTDDIIVGAPIATYLNAHLFVNGVVLRTDLSEHPSFEQLLERVKKVTLLGQAYQDSPYILLVDELCPQPDPSYQPLVQVTFLFEENVDLQQLNLSTLSASPWVLENNAGRYDLTLFLKETEAGLQGQWVYNTDLFGAATIARLNNHFQTLLEGIVANPQQSISELPLLTAPETDQLLREWNQREVEYPPDLFIHQLIAEQAAKIPAAIAVVFEDRQLTYGKLNNKANRLAHYLRSLNVETESIVGVFLGKSLDLIVTVLAILKSGAAYLPLDPSYPRDRLEFMLEDANPPVIITTSLLNEQLPRHKSQVICLDLQQETLTQQPSENPSNQTQNDSLTYIIYTSGSTGKPKGVTIEQSSLVNAYLGWEEAYHLTTATTSHLQMASFSFDVFAGDFVRALCSGSKLVLCPGDLLLESKQLYALICREKVDCAEFVPAVLRNLVEYLERTNQQLGFMNVIAAGSDSWYLSEYKRIQSLCGTQTRLINSYGVSEATIDSTYFEADVVDLADDRLIPIGRPFPNTKIYILDQQLQPVPIGVPGELHLGGIGLARGYLKRPDLTDSKFIPNPFQTSRGETAKQSSNGDRLYKTGDLVRYLPDGNIEFLGRIDYQVKIRGFRVELGEIEALLAQHSEIRETVVIVREDVAGDKRLFAYIVPTHAQTFTIDDLRDFLSQYLPNYMIPNGWAILDAFPMTPNGKIDRRALLAYNPLNSVVTTETIAPIANRLANSITFLTANPVDTSAISPTTRTEEILVGIWAKVLGLDTVSIHDNFFELGGHSLLAAKMIGYCCQSFERELSLRELFGSPTVVGLAQIIDRHQQPETKLSNYQIIPRRANPDRAKLSFVQQRLWFLHQLQPHSTEYQFKLAIRLNGVLNRAALQQSLDTIIARHETLRTNFINEDGHPIQVIQAPQSLELRLIDLQDCPPTERDSQLTQRLKQEYQRPFNLAEDLILRGCLFKLAPAEHVLLLVTHHIVFDGWSIFILWQELSSLYSTFCQGLSSSLPELPIQYADFAQWQHQQLGDRELDHQLQYWKQQLAGANPLLELPTDYSRPPIQTYAGASQSFVINQDLVGSLKAIGIQDGATLFMVLLAAFKTFLYRYSGQEDIIVGTPFAGRNRAETDSLIGFFVNTLVLRTDCSGNPSFQKLLGRVRQIALSAHDNQDLPLDRLVQKLQPERSLSYNPLFQVMFVLQNAPSEQLQLPGLTLTPLAIENGTAMFDLTLTMEETEQGLCGDWEYNTDLFDAATITRMMGHFQTLLEAIVDRPQQRVSELPLLTANQQHQLLVEWNNTSTKYPDDKCIHQLFEAQVEQNPNAIAVVFEDQQFTYRELNCRANQLAHHLQTLGVCTEVLVGLCIDRSLEMVVGILAILKAGGAYVPLDPAYPTERLADMLSDSQVSVLLTKEQLLPRLPQPPAHVVCIDTDWGRISQESQENPISNVSPENLAYVIYTSGSTGKPKGVMIQHQSLVSFTQTATVEYELSASDRVLQFASISFDAAAEEIYPCLISGGTLVLRTDEMLSDLQTFLQKCRDWKLTILDLPTAYWHQLTSELAIADLVLPESLRLVIIGGERALPERVQTWQKVVGTHPQLVNTYGPTEATIVATMYKLLASTPEDSALPEVPIGRTLRHVQAYLLDKYLNLTPVGVPGELHIGGVSLARGYLNRPDLTAEKFIPNPFSDEPGTRLYKTGDLVRYLPDGNIEFLGRTDHQVKIRGFRIEIGEIEAVLAQHPAVRETVAIVTEDHLGDQRLLAYVIPHSDRVPAATELRSFLKEKLPDYMLPSAFVTLDAIPLTPNGKVDRRALPAPDWEQPDLAEIFVAPRTPVEEALSDIWSQVLGVKQIGIKDNFFDLGGHSLLAIRLVAEIEKNLNLKIPLAALFELTTVAQMASFFQHNNSSAGSSHKNLMLDSIMSKQLKDSCSDSEIFGLNRAEYEMLMAILAGRKGKRPRQNSLMVAMREHGMNPPLFFCANSSAEILGLANNLGEEQPFYFLESGLTIVGNNQAKIKAIAAHHVDDILAVQPDSPYLLGGYCVGSLVAYEIAQQLLAKGKKVELLFFLDTYGNHPSYKIYEKIVIFMTDHRNKLARLGFGDRLRYIQTNIQRLILKRVVKITNDQEILMPYKPQRYPGKVTIFCGIPNKYEPIPPDRFLPIVPEWITLLLFKRAGWDRQLIPNLEIHKVVGDHISMREEPHIKIVAEKIKADIAANAFNLPS
jgi:amino acid adenylation domain-containing protein